VAYTKLVEKVISALKFVYKAIIIFGLSYLLGSIYILAKYQRNTLTVTSSVSALLVIFLMWVAISSLFTVIIGILRWVSVKGDLSKVKKAKSLVLKGTIGLIATFLVWYAVNLVSSFYLVFEIPAFTADHFRTNIFTRVCDYGGSSGVITSDPWYYKPDCSVTKKVRVAKKEGFYEKRLNECKTYCDTLQKNYFCNTYIITVGNAWGNGPENLVCTEITECPQIDCVKHINDPKSQMEEGI